MVWKRITRQEKLLEKQLQKKKTRFNKNYVLLRQLYSSLTVYVQHKQFTERERINLEDENSDYERHDQKEEEGSLADVQDEFVGLFGLNGVKNWNHTFQTVVA